MLYLVVYNAYYSYGSEWFIKSIFDSKEKAESMARIVCNEILEIYKERDIEYEEKKEEYKKDIMEYYIKIIPLTLNQIYKTSTIVPPSSLRHDNEYITIDKDNGVYIGGYEE